MGAILYAYQSAWLPASLLEADRRQRLADALFSATKHRGMALHFNKGLSGAPADAIAAAKDTAMNPVVMTLSRWRSAPQGNSPPIPASLDTSRTRRRRGATPKP